MNAIGDDFVSFTAMDICVSPDSKFLTVATGKFSSYPLLTISVIRIYLIATTVSTMHFITDTSRIILYDIETGQQVSL